MLARFPIILALLLPLSTQAGSVAAGLPPYVLELPAEVSTVLIAESDTSTLHRFTSDPHRPAGYAASYMSIGENGVGKSRAWDRKTPLGIYFINDRLDTERLHDRYGVLALPLDYPSAWDRRHERSGDGIWIHGVDPASAPRPALDTDGCLALPNDELLELDTHVQLRMTPVIIARRIAAAGSTETAQRRNALRAALDQWARSYRDGDWQTYLSLYADDFRYHGLDRTRWASWRVRSSAARPIEDYRIDRVYLLADPEEEGLYLSRFRQTIIDSNGPVVTTKRLYWRLDEDGRLRIVAEGNG